MDAPSRFLPAVRGRLAEIEVLRQREESAARRTLPLMLVTIVAGIALLWGGGAAAFWLAENFISRRAFAKIGSVAFVWALVFYGGYKALDRVFRMGDAERHDLRRAFNDVVLIPSLHDALPGFEVTSDTLFDHDSIKRSLLFHHNHNRIAHTCGFSGLTGGVPFRASVFRIAHRKHGAVLQPRAKSNAEGWSNERLGHFFSGIFVHLDFRSPFPVTVRLADPVYEQNPFGFETARAVNVVRSKSGDPAFDQAFLLILDQGQTTPPPIPEPLRHLCFELRQHFNLPVFLSFTETGVYLAVATGDGRLPMQLERLDESPAETLASELEIIQKVPAALEALRRALAAA
ncbi:MAG: hypothetical protein KJZ79_02860 [Bryobacteraceae bacterium]|nr:hypothetical protein [Bryobacteraceae bacterium]